MDRRELKRLDRKLSAYLGYFTEGMGRPERRRAMQWYLTGLLLDGERKSIEPIAARLVENESEVQAMRQRLQQCVVVSEWSDNEIRRRLAHKLEEDLPDLEAFIVDDTGLPKKGEHSVGVARQYSGTMGRIDNCQVATSLHVAGASGSGCIGMQLYLPEEWASDIRRRRAVGIPDEVVFKRKWQLALELIDDAQRWGLPKRIVIADAGYGDSTEFRDGLVERGLPYAVGISGSHLVWPPGSNPRRPKRRAGELGPPRTRYRDGNRKLISISELATTLTYRRTSWTDGTGTRKSCRLAMTRIRTAERHTKGRPPSDEQWLICEWRDGQDRPTKYHLCTLPADTSKRELAKIVKLRWRVERDYQELKEEIGLDHFEGRTWRGFHHHVTLCAVAHGFLAIQRALFPPGGTTMDVADGENTDAGHPSTPARILSDVPSEVSGRSAKAKATNP